MDGSLRIPILEEKVEIGVEEKTTGRVRVKTVTTAFVENASADLERSDVEVRRVVIDRVVDAAPDVRVEGNVTIIPVLEEILVVEKRLVLKEELHITTTVLREKTEVPVTLRRQQAVIERDQNPEADRGNT